MPLSPDQINNFSIRQYTDEELHPSVWQSQAACLGTDTEAFFPKKGGSARKTKEACLGCKVVRQCLEYALATPAKEDFGIWGGLSERERSTVRAAAKKIESLD